MLRIRFPKEYDAEQITNIIAKGSLHVVIILAVLLMLHDILQGTLMDIRFCIAGFFIAYLAFVRVMIRKGHTTPAKWLIVIFYELIVVLVLVHWGRNSAVGILIASFTILLPGVLMSHSFTFPIACITSLVLFLIHTLRVNGAALPILHAPELPPNLIDVVACVTIFFIMALVSWVSSRQTTRSLHRALAAEERLQKQKKSLAAELERESTRLRHIQLQQIQQLHRFAIIGQSAAATLHELSNHLSILNLDIDDLKQQVKHSKAIASAEEGIGYINQMVHKARAHLDTQDSIQTFNALPILIQSVKDMRIKFRHHSIKLSLSTPKQSAAFIVNGDPLSLMQCVSILLTNALDACKDVPGAQVSVSISVHKDSLTLTVADTGPGISDAVRASLFQPHKSVKSSGLGVGLYIAKHSIEAQYGGTLELLEAKRGASFQITIKRALSKANQQQIANALRDSSHTHLQPHAPPSNALP